MGETSLTGGESGSERRPEQHRRRYPERRWGFRAAGASVAKVVGPIVARHGGGLLARLKAEWTVIVGRELAAVTWPEALARGGTLKLRVAPAKALELQHRAPLVIERVNLFFGREAVTRLAIIQGPLPLAAPVPPVTSRPLNSREAASLDQQLSGVANPELRAALAGLGRRVIGSAE
jgi:hypothetical protein